MSVLNSNPIVNLKPKTQKRVLWILGVSTFILFIAISMLDSSLKTEAAPNGIVSFELAGSFNQSQQILTSWNHQAKLYAIQSLVIDYLFLISYSFFFAFLIFTVSKLFTDSNKDWFVRTGIVLGWLQFIAATLDAFENYFLLRLVFGSQNSLFSILAFYFASVKFLLILLGFGYIVICLILYFLDRRKT